MIVNETFSWSEHVDIICWKAAKRIGLLHRLLKHLPPLAIRHLYCTAICPTLEYASTVWNGLVKSDASKQERLQRRAARLISSSDFSTPDDILLARASPQALSRRAADQAILAFRLHIGTLPPHFMTAFSTWTTKPDRSASLRNLLSFRLPSTFLFVFLVLRNLVSNGRLCTFLSLPGTLFQSLFKALPH